MEAGKTRGRGAKVGYVAVLVGSASFVLSGVILAVTEPIPGITQSLFEVFTQGSGPDRVGGIMFLWSGSVILAVVATAGIIGKRSALWAPAALTSVVAMWSLMWIGWFLALHEQHPRVGYWAVLFSIVVVVSGTLMVLVSSQDRGAGLDPAP